MNKISLIGCHGTSLQSGNEIVQTKFDVSKQADEWLGDGIYFFINGINNNIEELASKWAKSQAWDNVLKKYKYEHYCVIKSTLEVSEAFYLDLTTNEGVEILEYLINKFLEKIKGLNKKLKFLDGAIINLARSEKILRIDLVKGDFYIKFIKERTYRIHLRTNNCTICSVFNAKSVIKSKTIVKTGEVLDATK